MKAQYKMILFEPKPGSGYRFPLGAVVRVGEYDYVIKNDALSSLDWALLGINPVVVNVMLTMMEVELTFDNADSMSISPYMYCSESLPVLDGVDDVVGWIEALWI